MYPGREKLYDDISSYLPGNGSKEKRIFIIKAPLTGSSLKEFEWEEKEEDFANINLKKN